MGGGRGVEPHVIPNFQNQFFTLFYGFLRFFDKIYTGKVKTIEKNIFYVERNQKILFFRKKTEKKILGGSTLTPMTHGNTPPLP